MTKKIFTKKIFFVEKLQLQPIQSLWKDPTTTTTFFGSGGLMGADAGAGWRDEQGSRALWKAREIDMWRRHSARPGAPGWRIVPVGCRASFMQLLGR